jgi:predicted RNA-binding Zn ribbon-like protein
VTKTNRPAPPFIADAYPLDFLNSIAAPTGTVIEWISNGDDLLSWLEKARMIPRYVAVKFRDGTDQAALDEIAVQACDLREWFRGYVAEQAGKIHAAGAINDLQTLNQILSRDRCFHQLEQQDDQVFQLQAHRRFDTPKDLLIPIAEAMATFISEANFERVKNCEGPTCTLWFHDVSKSHKRRWCDMAVCGNRAKAAAHRAKKRGE